MIIEQKEIKAVVFDMDGLMLDTERISQASWTRTMAEWGYELPHEVYLQAIGTTEAGTKQIFRRIFGEDFPIDAIRAQQRVYYHDHLTNKGIPIKTGLIALLDWLDTTSLKRIVASSTERGWVWEKLRISDLDSRFEQVVGGDEVSTGKPAPDIFLEAARRINIPAEQCLVLEDSEAGVRAAHAAGMLPLMVPDMKQPTPEIAKLAHQIFTSLDEVREFLVRHNESRLS
ncbi:HAD family phosphatase [Anaerolineales bacterium HSG6]|nr:HAD family phosphatase [Anaerolineales bacterium HSG6]MDM8531696.1 HAD family phosphatase [Anaerolineales bacterium HSG25]